MFGFLALGGSACKRESSPEQGTTASPAVPSVERVPPDLAGRVLAKVGDRVITVADYANVLDRMDRFERMRYQTPERRKALLEEMINTELMAREAERRGLDKQPETLAHLNQLLADEVRRRLRATLPRPEELPAEEVQAYYAAHRAELRLPERRRLAVVTVPSRAAAEKLLAQLVADPSVTHWNELVRLQSTASPPAGGLVTSVLGDVGFVTLEGGAGADPTVPSAVRMAAFKVPEVGGLVPQVVEEKGAFYVVRVTSVAPEHLPSLEEADSIVRARIIDERLASKEDDLQKQLEKTTPVEVNEGVISRLKRATP